MIIQCIEVYYSNREDVYNRLKGDKQTETFTEVWVNVRGDIERTFIRSRTIHHIAIKEALYGTRIS